MTAGGVERTSPTVQAERLVEIAAEPDPARRIERLLDAARDLLHADEVTLTTDADDRVLGTLHVYRERGHEWREDALHLAAGLADQAATAIEIATRYAGLQDSLERARIPARVNQLLTATLDLDVLLQEIATAAVKIIGAVVAILWVAAVATADKALEQLGRRRFDLVLSDHGLGLGMNGLALAAAIRDRWPGTRFILVTGWGGSLDPAEVEPLGVEAVISKPYRAPELRQQINARP